MAFHGHVCACSSHDSPVAQCSKIFGALSFVTKGPHKVSKGRPLCNLGPFFENKAWKPLPQRRDFRLTLLLIGWKVAQRRETNKASSDYTDHFPYNCDPLLFEYSAVLVILPACRVLTCCFFVLQNDDDEQYDTVSWKSRYVPQTLIVVPLITI